MDMIRKVFPYSLGAKEVKELVIKILVYLVAGIIIGALIGVLAKIPVLGLIFSLVGAIVDLYCFVGIILAVLDYMKVLK